MARCENAGFKLCVQSMFSGVSVKIFQSQFISIDSQRFVINLSKQISSEDFGSKSQVILIASNNVSCVFRLWFGKQMQPTSG
jgi:hypothetical protein